MESRANVFGLGKVLNGDLNMLNNKVVNVNSPTHANDVATKTYVDNSTTGGITSSDDLAFKSLNINGATLSSNNLAVSGSSRFEGGDTTIATGDFYVGTSGATRIRMIPRYLQCNGTVQIGRIGQGATGFHFNTNRSDLLIQKNVGSNPSETPLAIIRCEGGISVGKITNPDVELDVEGDCVITGSLTASNKAFRISHPNPQFKNTHHLNHSCIESNTAGDCYYTYKVYVEEECDLQLPPYFKYLIDHTTIKAHITPIDNLIMCCYSVIDEDHIKIKTSAPSNVSVLISGTRKDIDALKHWKGESTLKPEPKPVINEVVESEYN